MIGKFDKVIKEDLLELGPFLVGMLLGIEIPRLEHLKDKVIFTIEREADEFLRACHDDPSQDYGIHFEFQAQDVEMRSRCLVYFGLFFDLYGIPLKQFVIYIGEALPRLISNSLLELPGCRYEYEFIDLRRISKSKFLASDRPECFIFAVLADFEGAPPEEVAQTISLITILG